MAVTMVMVSNKANQNTWHFIVQDMYAFEKYSDILQWVRRGKKIICR